MPFSSVAAEVSVLKDIVLTVGAVVAAIVAVSGLSTWKRQLKGETEYELTRRLLKHTYSLREAIKTVRYPSLQVPEVPLIGPDGRELSREQRRHMGLVKAYETRWEKVTEARDNLQTEMLEAEVLWGANVNAQFEALFKLQGELLAEIRAYLSLSDPSVPDHTKDALHEFQKEKRSVMYDSLGSMPDPYSDELARAVTEIESYLKPHLAR
jgi:hypothetical protein